jgi:hypothetical protein
MARTRNKNGQYREKRWDTHMWTIENKYWRDFNVRSDIHLDTYLEKNNIESLNNLITWK